MNVGWYFHRLRSKTKGSNRDGYENFICSSVTDFFAESGSGFWKLKEYVLSFMHSSQHNNYKYNMGSNSVQLLTHVQLFVTPWTAARQASLSITNPQSLLKLMSIESVMPSDHLILCRPLLLLPSIFPSIRVFLMIQLFASGSESIGVSTSTSVLPMNIQDWFPLGWTCWISLQSKGLSRVFSNTTVQKHQFFDTQLSLQSNSHIRTWPLEKP